jgi:hypothetical protein
LGWAIGNFAIIDGCVNNSGVVTNGFVFINGELYPFQGGNIQENVRIFKTNVDRAFQNGEVKTVYEEYFVTFGSGAGEIPWANFKRPATLINISERLTATEDALALAQAKLDTIEEGAEVNVQSDYTQNDNAADDYIKNKPNTTAFLLKGSYNIGDIAAADVILSLPFADVGTSNYIVVGSLVSQNANYNADNDVFWMVKNKASDSFDLIIRETSAQVQNLRFDYALIPQ